MSNKDKINKAIREFRLTTLALLNKNTVFLLTIALTIFGLLSYVQMPKELFPEISPPYVMVQVLYPGNPPVDIENLITRPVEKELESINGIKYINSTCSQDASNTFIEFNTNVNIEDALQDVKDAVDKAKSELPNDLPMEPMVVDLDLSEFPIININLSGDFSIDELKGFAEILEEQIEKVSEISKVDIQGVDEKEIKINVDQHKLEANQLGFGDIESAVAYENVSISGGEMKLDNIRRSVRTIGEFSNTKEIENIIIKSEKGNIVYLKDVAEVEEGYEEAKSFARLDKQAVVSLQVIKKGGENLLSATSQIEDILVELKANNTLPESLNITITNDQSEQIKKQLTNLENSMIMGIIFVILVLFFFLGTRNALFVGLAIPLSMFLSFVILKVIDYRINMIILFGLILALGMLVDNAIVVVENIYRFIQQGYSKFEAAKRAVGEIAIAIIASTATTLAAFFPLAFWDSMVGEFMKYLPITLIIVLSSSLFVALVIIPVFATVFIKKESEEKAPSSKRSIMIAAILFVLAIVFHMISWPITGSLLLIGALLTICNLLFLNRAGKWFQNNLLELLEQKYIKVLEFVLRKRNPLYFTLGTVFLLIFTIKMMMLSSPEVEYFPSNDPNYITILTELPTGTDIHATDSFMLMLESEVISYVNPFKEIIKSVLTNVGNGAVTQDGFSARGGGANRGLITVSFVDFEDRKNISTSDIMKMFSDKLTGKYPGITFTIEKDKMGPPTGKPINLEISGKEFAEILRYTDTLQHIIEQANIEGIEGLKIDLDIDKPEILVNIDRERARRFGLSTAQIASTIRTAIFGKEISDFKIGEDKYPIQLRMKEKYRHSISSIMNQKITFRNNMGKLMQIPISAVADFSYSTTYGSVMRKDLNRVVTLQSNVIEGFNANEVNAEIKSALEAYTMPEGYEYKFTGEQQDQEESQAFLFSALLIAVSLILIILVTQFNSLVKPLIIIASVIFSTIGVLGGITIFDMSIIVVMTGVGIISLAGVVVNNAIVLIDYIDYLKKQKKTALGIPEDDNLPLEEAVQCIVEGGKTRLRPVLLTAITTILGLFPMATGMNIDFAGLLTDFSPNIYFGGDMVKFWGPISWTVIFGLTFATFLTLIIVPAMYYLANMVKHKYLIKAYR